MGQAAQALETGKRLDSMPETAAAARRGELSPQQTAAIADAAGADPAAEGSLLHQAKRGSLQELKDECARTKAAGAPDPEGQQRSWWPWPPGARKWWGWRIREGVPPPTSRGGSFE